MKPPLQHIADRIKIEHRGYKTPCWIWQGPLSTRGGYGRARILSTGSSRRVRIHRLTHEMLVGPIPEGMEIDHLCMVKACCNPDHLEAVAKSENLRRAHAAGLLTAPPRPFIRPRKDCGHGADKLNHRNRCRVCYNARTLAWLARKRLQRLSEAP